MKQLTILLVLISFALNAQERLILSEKKIDSKVRRTYIYLRDDLNGFEKVNETTYKMIGIDDSCNDSNPVMIDGVQVFGSMPCFRDYIIQKASSENNIVTWGRLKVEDIEFSSEVNNWETDKINYVGSWAGAMASGEPGDGCKCSFSFTIGDYLEIEFYGTSLSFYGERNPHLNTANVYLDGLFIGEINEYADTPGNNNLVEFITLNNLEQTTHVLKVVVTGKEPLSTGTGFVFHKVNIENNDNVIISDTLFTRQDTVYIEKIVYDTVYIDSSEPSVVISSHNDIKEAYEKATGVELTRKGSYQLRMRSDSTFYIKQPDIEIK